MPEYLTGLRFTAVNGERVSIERLMANADHINNCIRNLAQRRITRSPVLLQFPALTSSSPPGDLEATLTSPSGDLALVLRRAEITLNANDTEDYTFSFSNSTDKTITLTGDTGASVTETVDFDDFAASGTLVELSATGSWDMAGAVVVLHYECQSLTEGVDRVAGLHLDDGMTFAEVSAALNTWLTATQAVVDDLAGMTQGWLDIGLLPYPSDDAASTPLLAIGQVIPVCISPGSPFDHSIIVSSIVPVTASAKRYTLSLNGSWVVTNTEPATIFASVSLLPPDPFVAYTNTPNSVVNRRNSARFVVGLSARPDGSSVDQFEFLRFVRACYLDS